MGRYLIKYKAMQTSFDLKTLVKKSNFQIVPGEGWTYFGQMEDGKKNGKGLLVSKK